MIVTGTERGGIVGRGVSFGSRVLEMGGDSKNEAIFAIDEHLSQSLVRGFPKPVRWAKS